MVATMLTRRKILLKARPMQVKVPRVTKSTPEEVEVEGTPIPEVALEVAPPVQEKVPLPDFVSAKPGVCIGCPLYMAARMPRLGASAKADILVVGGKPLDSDFRLKAFSNSDDKLVRQMFAEMFKGMPQAEIPRIEYTYAVQCSSEAFKNKINADMIAKCNNRLMLDIDKTTPTVILAVGVEALHALGFVGGISDYRGNLYTKKFNANTVHVVPSFSAGRMRKSPGLIATFKRDIKKCLDVAQEGINPIQFNLMCPTTGPEILAALDVMEAEINARHLASKRRVGVAIDTEATSLEPWHPDFRMISISFCWDNVNNRGLAFPIDHRKAKLSLKDRETICQRVEDIFQDTTKIAEIMHNGKFDMKVLLHAYQIDLPAIQWDTLLGEHLIDEDKKGEYGLKQLTRDWFPGAGKYEDELKAYLQEVSDTKKRLYKEAQAIYNAKLTQCIAPYWDDLGEDERIHQVGSWMDRKLLSYADNKVIELKYKKQSKKQIVNKAKPVLIKHTEKLILALFNALPDSELPPAILRQVEKYRPQEALKSPVTYEDVPLDVLLKYGAIDAVMTLKIFWKQQECIATERDKLSVLQRTVLIGLLRNWPGNTWGYSNISMPLTELLTEMEYKGVKLDRDKIVRYRDYLQLKAEETKAKILDQVGYTFNPNSGPELCKILFDELKLPVLKRSAKTGEPSTDAAVLNDLYEKYQNPLLKELLHYRKLEKCRGTYLESWLARSAVDGKMHTSFNINGTATYRLSSSNSNLQNVMFYLKGVDDPDGKKDENGKPLYLNLKSVFIPDSEEYDFYDLDIANAEMRMLCAYSRDPALIKAFNEGMDLHCLTASGIGEYTYDEIKQNKDVKSSPHYKLRQLAKAINFGTIYCMGPSTLVTNLWETSRIVITEVEAKAYLDKFFTTYPGVAAYIDRTTKFVQRHHFAHTYTGRLRRFHILDYNTKEGHRCGRQGVNARIQCSSAEVVNTNLVDVNTSILKPNNGRVLLTVHDSMAFQLPKGFDGPTLRNMLDTQLIEGVRAKFPWLPVPWKYDVDKGANYGSVGKF